jgi:hypothetical protein
LASDKSFPADELAAADEARAGSAVLSADPALLADFMADAVVLTDDFAPADQLMTR